MFHFHQIRYLKNFKSSKSSCLKRCAMNCVANGKITQNTDFADGFVPDDSGACLGVKSNSK